jgi:hypothetical protein
VIDQNKTLMSLRIAFTANQCDEILEWLAENLRNVSAPVLRGILTHEASAIVPVMETTARSGWNTEFSSSIRGRISVRISTRHDPRYTLQKWR